MLDKITQIKIQILKMEIPALSFTEDPEIERYFELRKNGKTQEAFSVYNTYLKTRYPDDNERVAILRAYRSKDPRFQAMLLSTILRQAEQTSANFIKIITVLTDDVSKLNLNDAYSVIRTMERIISAFSKDRYQAISVTEKIAKYARMLSFRANAMERVSRLVTQYVTNSMMSVETYKSEMERRRKIKKAEKKTVRTFDFSAIHFSPADISRIVISQAISRPEDKVIAYCLKYWSLTSDTSFERIVYLYSKKYSSHHYQVFQTIKNGKLTKRRDEEILNSVLTEISSGYYYNINGDLYLQGMWRRVKELYLIKPDIPELPAPAVTQEKKPAVKKSVQAEKRTGKTAAQKNAKTAVPGPRGKRKTKRKNAAGGYAEAAKPADTPLPQKTPAPARPLRTAVRAGTSLPAMPSVPKTAAAEQPEQKGPERQKETVLRTSAAEPRPGQPALSAGQRGQTAEKTAAPKKPYRVHFKKRKQEQTAVTNNSVSELIKKMSGMTYDLYKDLFFARIRPSIRTVLAKNRVRKMLFDSNQNEAEEILFSFLEDNYENPYMDWGKSSEREKLSDLGYSVESVLPIIRHWFENKKI